MSLFLYVDPDEVDGSVSIVGVSASDSDAEDTVTYSLSGAPAGFSINTATGVISYSGSADGLFDQTLTVVVSDGKLDRERQYTIKRDQRPEFEGPETFYVDPDEDDETAWFNGVRAQDADRGDTVTYSLSGAPEGFSIDPTVGDISYTYSGSSEGIPDGTELTVVASDGKLENQRIITIHHDQRPEFAGGATLYLDPDEVGGHVLPTWTIRANDADADDTVLYRLDSVAKGFDLNVISGLLSYSGPLSGVPESMTLWVMATDRKLSAERQYTIMYDQRPEFTGPATLYVDPDDVDGSVLIPGVRAQDADTGDTVSYRLEHTPPGVSLNAATGAVSYSGTVSGLSGSGMALGVYASDGKLEAYRLYTIKLDRRPEFAEGTPATVYVDPDEISASVPLVQVSASDSDEGDTVTYRLRGAPEGFSIDSSDGGITYSGSSGSFPDSVSLTVIASDGKLESERQITLVADQRPEFEGPETFYVDPDEDDETAWFNGVRAQDADRGDTVTYSLSGAPEGFSIDPTVGDISYTYSGSSEGIPDGTELTVVASDGKLENQRIITIHHDQRPEFAGGATLYLDPDEVGGHVLPTWTIRANDADADDTVLYRLDSVAKGLTLM